MTLRKTLWFTFVVLMIAACSSLVGQVATGIPQFGTYGGGPFDAVNLGNLNVHFAIPIIQKAGRGMPFDYTLTYDGAVWTPSTSSGQKTWTPVFNWGWSAQTAIKVGYISYLKITQHCDSQSGTYTIWSNYAYHDPWGGVHPFDGTLEADMTHC